MVLRACADAVRIVSPRPLFPALIGAAILLGGAGNALAQPCSTAQQAALDVKMLQTELMVAALACGERAAYNTFVTDHKDALSRHGKALKGLFTAAFGAQGEKKLNAHVTRLANEASARHVDDVKAFCGEAARLLGTLNGGGAALDAAAADHPLSGTATGGACVPRDVEVASGSALR